MKAAESMTAYALVLDSYTTAIWNSSNSVYPDTTVYRLMPDETDSNGVRIENDTAFIAWYATTDFDTSADLEVTSADLIVANSDDGKWIAASSLTASAACIMVAASLF